jgi:cyclic pyranopterin phosphate synthase
MLEDKFGRKMTDLRVSITDRCNYKCVYCMPANFLSRDRAEVLTFEEITRLSRIFINLGIEKLRITGGEPLVRKEVEKLIARLAEIEGLHDLALTTNGFFLEEKAERLAAAGLRRLNVSLDSLRPDRFHQLTKHNSFHKVIAGLKAARAAGFSKIKVNVVLIRGMNDDEILDFIDWGLENDYQIRFIEFMPLDGDESWQRELIVPGRVVYQTINGYKPLEPVAGQNPSDPAKRYRFADGSGEVGIIASVTEPFCGTCSRLRLTADGQVRTCLFSTYDHDLKTVLRAGASDEELSERIRRIVQQKEDGHHINDPDFVRPNRAMVFIGG